MDVNNIVNKLQDTTDDLHNLAGKLQDEEDAKRRKPVQEEPLIAAKKTPTEVGLLCIGFMIL